MVQVVPKEVLEKSILPLIPVSRLGEPEEIAAPVGVLAADEAGAITGSTLSINGGQYMNLIAVPSLPAISAKRLRKGAIATCNPFSLM